MKLARRHVPPTIIAFGAAGMAAVRRLMVTTRRSGIETALAEIEERMEVLGTTGALKEAFTLILDWVTSFLEDEDTRRTLARDLHASIAAEGLPKNEAERDVLDRIHRLAGDIPPWAPLQASFARSHRDAKRGPVLEYNVSFAGASEALRKARKHRDPERRAHAAVEAALKVYEGPYKHLLEFLVALDQLETRKRKKMGSTLGALERAIEARWPTWLEAGAREKRNRIAHALYTPVPREGAILLHATGKVPEQMIPTDELLEQAERIVELSAGILQVVRTDVIARTMFSEDALKLAFDALALRDPRLGRRATAMMGEKLLGTTARQGEDDEEHV